MRAKDSASTGLGRSRKVNRIPMTKPRLPAPARSRRSPSENLKFIGTAITLLWLAIFMAPAQAASQRYALVVGVSGYSDPIDPLEGPKNDVTLLVNLLTSEHWVSRSHMWVLADELEQAFYQPKVHADGLPTYRNIVDALDRIPKQVSAGDEVLIYLSGHGSYIPAVDRPGVRRKPDGVDEIFLPLDIKGWEDEKGVTNDLLDHDLGIKIAAIRGRGAFVWFVADSCNSGTLSRGTHRVRSVNPVSQLGIPARLFAGAQQCSPTAYVGPSQLYDGEGFVGFYATLPSLEEIEERFPKGGAPSELRPHGLLTWYWLRALKTAQLGTFSNLTRAIAAGYTEWGEDAPVPMFEGDLERAIGFGPAAGKLYSLVAQDRNIAISAGLLDDLDVGSRVEILDLRHDPPRLVATGQVKQSSADRSILAALLTAENSDSAGAVAASIRTTPSAFAARVTERSVSYVLTVAIQPDQGPEVSASDRALLTRVHSAMSSVLALPRDQQDAPLEPREWNATPEIRLEVRNGRLWFVPALGELVTKGGRQFLSLAPGDVSASSFNRTFGSIARGRNLVRVAKSLQRLPLARHVNTQVRLQPQRASGDHRCPTHQQGQSIPGSSTLIFDSTVSRSADLVLNDCDLVFITVKNSGSTTLDITPLYVDPWLRIYFLGDYVESYHGPLRLRPGESQPISYTEHTGQTFGVIPTGQGHIVLFATQADEGASTASDYRFLATDKNSTARGQHYTAGSIEELLASAAVGNGTLRSAPQADTRRTAAIVLDFLTSEPRPSQ